MIFGKDAMARRRSADPVHDIIEDRISLQLIARRSSFATAICSGPARGHPFVSANFVQCAPTSQQPAFSPHNKQAFP